ncbi:hypothetical protein F4553_001909 [Allocatelliglobosispora scoriae]|uniref:Uncharacterized protein n=1 Tax=Allocatelliglobosispora scoriae TaxID=643052 RepID=A0A841BNZ6_9ACTN|nr:hypothetical protein [Allocatelliglobosispora scoriae]MBB5868530.1 hypothetical protein [Allocatelliglobosispora scoriae]
MRAIDGDDPAAVLLASFLLIAHRLAEAVAVEVDKRVRSAYARAHRPAPEVRLIQLRPTARPHDSASPTDGSQPSARREPDHRWWVSPFTRLQPCGPGRSQRETVLILPFVNGPRGKPLRASTTVGLLAAPKSTTPSGNPIAQSHVDGEQ